MIQEDIELKIVVPRENPSGRTITRRRSSDHFHVLITNISNHVVRIWKEDCSEGYECLSFEWTDSSGRKGLARKRPIDWTVNKIGFWELAPAESLVLNVFLTKPKWMDFPEPPLRGHEVSMRAIFDGHPMDENLKALLRKRGLSGDQLEVWAGQVKSVWGTYVFWD